MDDAVRAECLRLWALLDQNSLLDTLDQEVLDSVDRVVFDGETTAECRSLALLFMMGHTEGFELLEEEETGAESKSRGKASKAKAKKGGAAQTGDVRRRQRCAVQLEILCELISLHVANNSSLLSSSGASGAGTSTAFRSNIRYLVEAFNGLEDPRRNVVR